MFKVKEIIKTSGRGRTASWEEQTGTVTKVLESTVLVQWHDSAVEDEMKFDELISTGEFTDQVPNNYRRLCISEDEIVADMLVTIND
jgi:hypothetical protein